MDIEIRIIIRGVGSDVTVETHQVSDEAQQFLEDDLVTEDQIHDRIKDAIDGALTGAEQVDKVFA